MFKVALLVLIVAALFVTPHAAPEAAKGAATAQRSTFHFASTSLVSQEVGHHLLPPSQLLLLKRQQNLLPPNLKLPLLSLPPPDPKPPQLLPKAHTPL